MSDEKLRASMVGEKDVLVLIGPYSERA